MPFVEETFDREKHVYKDDKLSEVLQQAVQFFNSTPALKLPLKKTFRGAGVYALYYVGKKGVYAPYGTLINQYEFNEPIYIGKADPPGKRQSRSFSTDGGTKLYSRLREHVRSISATSSLKISDFACRFVICEGETKTMIPAFEAALTARYRPLWNTFVDGFGNHDQGGGRSDSIRSQWDTLHPGRRFAEQLSDNACSVVALKKRIRDFFLSRAPYYTGR